MSRNPRRILLVDNDKEVLASVGYSLKLAGYHVLPADNVDTALKLLQQEIFHLAIIDIRLEDERHKEDLSGFQVALQLPRGTPCLIYTAYEDKEIIRQALGKIKAREIVDKTRKDAASSLVDLVNDLFASEIKVNFNLEIEGDFDLDRIAFQIEVPPEGSGPPPAADDLRQVLQTLFSEAKSLHLVSLLSQQRVPATTQSGSVVLQAQPHFSQGPGVPVIVKLSARDEVARETENHRLIEPFLGGQHLAVLKGEAYSRQVGGLVYSLIGAEDWQTIRTFGDLFFSENAPTVIGLLERFFNQTFKGLLTNARQEKIDLVAAYTRQLRLTPDRLRLALAEVHPPALTEPHLQFKELPGSFKNPILWALPSGEFRPFEVLSRQCLCHGDLHSRNILVDTSGHFWLIDFARAGDSHALRDFVELETDIKFNLLQVADLKALHQFERALLTPLTFLDSPPQCYFADPRLDHAYQVIMALRHIASTLLGLAGDMGEYYQALFIHTLNIIRLRHISPEWKQYALLSAALIRERLEG